MVTVRSFEGQVRLIEGFDIRIRHDGGRDARDDMKLDAFYPFVRAAPGTHSVKHWRDSRFARTLGDLQVEVLDAAGHVVHGRTQLRTVRRDYGPPAPKTGRWPTRWVSPLEDYRRHAWMFALTRQGRYMLCPRCEVACLHPFDLDTRMWVKPGWPANHHCTMCGWRGWLFSADPIPVGSERELLRIGERRTLKLLADYIDDVHLDGDCELIREDGGVTVMTGGRGVTLDYPFSYTEFWDVIQYLDYVNVQEAEWGSEW